MSQRPAARRSRKQEPDDAFIARVLAFTAWAKQNARVLTIATILGAIAISAGIYYINFQSQLRQQAATQLAQIQETEASGNRALAIRDLGEMLDRFDGTPAAKEARLMLAKLHMEEGDAAAAVPVLEPLAEDLSDPLGPPAAMLLGSALEASEDHDRAVAVYTRIADRAPYGYQRTEALDAAAQVRMRQGSVVEAIDLYERLLESVSANDPQRGMYEMRLAEARARSGNAAS